MLREERQVYAEALRQRRAGHVSELDGSEPFDVIKPEFYADAKILTDAVMDTMRTFSETHPPYGLIDRKGNTITTFRGLRNNSDWLSLESSLVNTARHAFDITAPPQAGCPYHELLNAKVGGYHVQPFDDDERGLDTLRQKTYGGAASATSLIVPLLRQMPLIKHELGATSSAEELARSSASLLRAPLNNPQQWARAFVFSLGGGYDNLDVMDRTDFFPADLIHQYTQLVHDVNGAERIEWNLHPSQFRTRVALKIPSRVLGSEMEMEGPHVSAYPAGTKLDDISTDEPTIGCPGKEMAYYMWNKSIDIIAAEKAW